MEKKNKNLPENKKLADLSGNVEISKDQLMTTDQGVRINDDQNSLTAGDRGATLLEDLY